MIIPAQLHHLNDIIFIEKSAFNQPWTKNQFMNDIQSELDSENWVYVINELVTGYIFGWIIQGEFHLNNIAVHPEYLRRSIGKNLIQHIIARVILRNVGVILLEVSAENIPGRECYQSLGFNQMGIRKDYYSKGDDAILYNLELNTDG